MCVNRAVPSTSLTISIALVFAWAWEQGWSPFGIVRNLGPWGPMMVARYSSRRFAALAGDELRDMHDYCWSYVLSGTFAPLKTELEFVDRITRAKGSSEYCISHLLAPGAYARMPLVNRVQQLKIPVVFSCTSLYPSLLA
jgi:cardiolipin-specific phospholipase